MFRISMCDDSTEYLRILEKQLLEECVKRFPKEPKCAVGPSFVTAEEVLAYLKSASIDVLFLDIDMPQMNGFELAAVLCKEYKDTLIVFMSAYDNFVYDSFEFSPFAYMRKSHMETEIPRLIDRIVEKRLDSNQTVTLCTKDGDMTFRLKDILYIESRKNYFVVYCTGGRSYECRGTMAQVEEYVLPHHFFRTHSAILVNMEHVDRIVDNIDALIEGVRVPIAQRRIYEFRRAYSEYVRRRLGQ